MHISNVHRASKIPNTNVSIQYFVNITCIRANRLTLNNEVLDIKAATFDQFITCQLHTNKGVTG